MSEPRGKIYDSILETIGGTPLVRLPHITAKYDLKANILAKLEFFNPLASVKDRSILAMFEAAEKAGEIKAGETILVEASAGNSAISLAAIAAAKNYKLQITMPENVSYDRRKVIEHYDAEIHLTRTDQGMRGAVEKAEALLKQHAEKGHSFKLFENAAAIEAHAAGTAQEIWADTAGKLDFVVAGVGTGATVAGLSKTLKAQNAELKIIAVEPEESAVLSGQDPAQHKIEGIGAGFVPKHVESKPYDIVAKINSERALEVAREIAKTEGIPCGISSGAGLAAAIELAKLPDNAGKTIVVIFPSFAERYVNSDLFEGAAISGS